MTKARATCTERHVGRDVPRHIGIQFIAKRILNRCVPGPNGCLLYTGSKHEKGYGQTNLYGRTRRTHRLVYEAKHGPIPPGMLVCHDCDTPACNNVKHMWLGSILENGLDAKKKKRCKYQKIDHCKHGHPLFGPNMRPTKLGGRSCRACQRASMRKAAGWPKSMWFIPPMPKGTRPAFPMSEAGESK